VLDILVQLRPDKRPAVRFLQKVLKGLAYVPRVVITDKLASYGAALREVLPGVEHRRHKGLNNRAENSHQPKRSGSSPPTTPSPATSAGAATASPPLSTARPPATLRHLASRHRHLGPGLSGAPPVPHHAPERPRIARPDFT